MTQDMLDAVFDRLVSGRITELRYEEELDKLEKEYPDEVRKHFGRRKDGRTFGKFGVEVYQSTAMNEQQGFLWWWGAYGPHYFGDDTPENYGVNDAGKLLMKSPKNDFSTPDFRLVKSGTLIEFKYCPTNLKATYKIADLKHYADAGRCYLLTVYGKHYIPRFNANRVAGFTLSSPQQVSILSKLPGEARREVGYKPAIQFSVPLENFEFSKLTIQYKIGN